MSLWVPKMTGMQVRDLERKKEKEEENKGGF
jgi:hypothetical protein